VTYLRLLLCKSITACSQDKLFKTIFKIVKKNQLEIHRTVVVTFKKKEKEGIQDLRLDNRYERRYLSKE